MIVPSKIPRLIVTSDIVEATVTQLHDALQVGGLRGLSCHCKQLHEVRHTGSLQGAHG